MGQYESTFLELALAWFIIYPIGKESNEVRAFGLTTTLRLTDREERNTHELEHSHVQRLIRMSKKK
jgi:hypothetical protein